MAPVVVDGQDSMSEKSNISDSRLSSSWGKGWIRERSVSFGLGRWLG